MTRDEILARLDALEEEHRAIRERHDALMAEHDATRWWQFIRRGEIVAEGRELVWAGKGIVRVHRKLCYQLRRAPL